MFAKIEDGILIYAKIPYHVGDKLIFTNDPAAHLQNGYKKVILTEKPYQEGYDAVSSWIETDDAITQTWTFVEIVEEPTQTDDTADMQAALNLLGVVPEEETT